MDYNQPLPSEIRKQNKILWLLGQRDQLHHAQVCPICNCFIFTGAQNLLDRELSTLSFERRSNHLNCIFCILPRLIEYKIESECKINKHDIYYTYRPQQIMKNISDCFTSRIYYMTMNKRYILPSPPLDSLVTDEKNICLEIHNENDMAIHAFNINRCD